MLLFLLACEDAPIDSVTPYKSDDVDGDGWTVGAGDCDDNEPDVNPGVTETWYDGTDADCDGNDADQDGDGAAIDTDCDDLDPTRFPGAAEHCDEVDEDCDGEVDDEPVDGTPSWTDADGDSYGDPDSETRSCTVPADTVANGDDCDDTDATISPAGAEVCDGVDQDCDGAADNGTTGTWYTDADGDGHGDPATASDECSGASGQVSLGDDCDDTDAAVSPGGTETCNSVDDDCDDATDEDATDAVSAWTDADGDGYGEAAAGLVCTLVDGLAAMDGDCDDSDAAVAPGMSEVCDSIDNDCDGDVDEADVGTASYTDADGDGHGDPATASYDCTPDADSVPNGDDCDDTDPDLSPSADETCDGIDQDCDGVVDDNPVDGDWTYPDNDGDGYGSDADAFTACEPSGLETGGDCDDSSARNHPGATEVCDHQDNNCVDGTDDESGAGQLDGEVWTDRATLFATGTSTDPFVVGDQSSYDLVVTDTSIHLCTGTWYMKFVAASAGSHLRVTGSGPDLTTVTTAGTTAGTMGSIISATNSTIDVSDLTLSGGIGSSGTSGGAVAVAHTTGSTTPSAPNVTLTGVVVSGNSTDKGGAIAINNYGWVALVDTLVTGNTATTAGGAAWIQDTGVLTCEATGLGSAGIYGNEAPSGGGVWFDSATHGSLTATGCDWGSGSEDNTSYDVEVKSGAGTCYPDATDLSDTVACSGGTCTATTDTSCP